MEHTDIIQKGFEINFLTGILIFGIIAFGTACVLFVQG